MQRDCPSQNCRQQAAGSRQRRIRAAVLLACCVLTATIGLSAGGCQKSKTTSPVAPPPRWTNVTLTVACPDGPPRLLFDRAGAAWARQTGAKIRYVSPSSDVAADVVVLQAADMTQWA